MDLPPSVTKPPESEEQTLGDLSRSLSLSAYPKRCGPVGAERRRKRWRLVGPLSRVCYDGEAVLRKRMGGGGVETEIAALIPPHYSISSAPAGSEPANTGVDKYHHSLTHIQTHALSGGLVMMCHSGYKDAVLH